MLQLFANAESHAVRAAIITSDRRYTYRQLLDAGARIGASLLNGAADLAQSRIAFLVPPSFEYVATQWGIWRAGGVAVPMALSHPPAELDYIVNDAQISAVVVHPDWRHSFEGVNLQSVRVLTTEVAMGADPVSLPVIDKARRAMIVYTSGTTSRPKGVVTTHANIQAQVESLIEAWKWSANDHILNVLPLHHVHGIINVLTCALWAGAICEFTTFDSRDVLGRFVRGDLTLFMAVPTIYSKLISQWQRSAPADQEAIAAGCRAMRLMVSGSAALPVRVLELWKSITGHVLLERYGLTEIGMALSNPLYGERRPGFVGNPLPGVEIRRVNESGVPVAPPDTPGEIEVRGSAVFLEYWGNAHATQTAFHDGWFRTGDVAAVEAGMYRILGRMSVDIIKTGGYKISALEIEEVMRLHPAIRECAIVGVPDEAWGERVAMCVESDDSELNLELIRNWAKAHLAHYKLPTRLLIIDELPRNALGKVHKPTMRRLFQE